MDYYVLMFIQKNKKFSKKKIAIIVMTIVILIVAVSFKLKYDLRIAVEWIGSLGLVDANYCFWNGLAMRVCCAALRTMSSYL